MPLKAGYNRYILLCIILKLKNDVRLENDEFRRSITKNQRFFIYFIYFIDLQDIFARFINNNLNLKYL